MDTQLELIVTVMTWGSVALLAWGGVLVVGEVLASSRSRERRTDREADNVPPRPLAGGAH